MSIPSSKMPVKVFMKPNVNNIVRGIGLFWLDPADDVLTPNYFDNTAVVFATLYDQWGNAIPGCTNLDLVYVTSSQGDFAGVTPAAVFSPAVGTGYRLFISATQGAAHNEWNIDCEVAS